MLTQRPRALPKPTELLKIKFTARIRIRSVATLLKNYFAEVKYNDGSKNSTVA